MKQGISCITTNLIAGWLLATLVTSGASAQEIDRELVFRGVSESRTLWRRGFTLNDDALEKRLQSLLDALVSEVAVDPAVQLEAHVFLHPDLNAFALPDGSVYLFAGLLSELNSTDELAFVIAHEAQHSIGWHAQKNIEQAHSKSAFFETISILGSVAAMGVGSSAYLAASLANTFGQLGLALVATASITGYGRSLERNADETGLSLLQRSGYSGCGAVNAIRVLSQDHDDPGRVANLFWGSHPRLQERESYLQERLQVDCDWDRTVSDDYASIKWPMTKLTASLWVDYEMFERALRPAMAYLDHFPDDPEIHHVLGDVYRGIAVAKTQGSATGQADTLALAEASYRKALELSADGHRAALRGLAQIAKSRADTSSCIAFLERYLADDVRVPYRRVSRRMLDELSAHYTGTVATKPGKD